MAKGMKMKQFLIIIVLGFLVLFVAVNPARAFVLDGQYSSYAPAEFFAGVWHGLLAAYSLIARWFIPGVVMYAMPNIGWFYNLGFLIGIGGSIPIGWAAAILSTIGHLAA